MWSKLLDFYLPRAIEGDPESQFEIAEIWLHDLGSPTMALPWYRRAAHADHPDAAARYAVLLLKQVPPDYPAALFWAARASIKGSRRGRLIVDLVRQIRPHVISTDTDKA